ncbi:site-specific integrase [Stieleria sp. TO1_6]|uniref:tyrosine-type recombinase/integrase n=1 Tax=Stieleria tagensis TaxID=2956795 RepID=UPI00209B37A6|nr:tyrosine-type recombinase/integrase [Stieleria tagensis]MCO8124492.1 site-specific integrase [Stieleria tagensis]
MSVKRGTTKPKKPHADFPLTPNGCGQWSKKIKGKVYYFGAWDDPDAALRRYLAEKDSLLAGVQPTKANGTGTVGWLCNTFMNAKEQQVKDGDLSQRTLNNYHLACKAIAAHFGKGRPLNTLGPADFANMRAKFPKNWGPVSVNTRITSVSAVFKYAYDSGAVPNRINLGLNFKRVSQKRLRLHAAEKPSKYFTAAEVHQLIDASPVQLKAMILLCLNAGYGPADCGRLRISDIDFKRNWISGLREKTAIARAAWLWPETMSAINKAIQSRPSPRRDEWSDLVFVTRNRKPWHLDGDKSYPIQQAFKKAAETAGVYRKGVGIYAMRHVLETEGGTDQVAINHVMGHIDPSMAGTYRESVDGKRIKQVCQRVRKWFQAGKPKAKSTAKKRGAK